MKKSRFTEEQIAYALKQAELGTTVGEICRKTGEPDILQTSDSRLTLSVPIQIKRRSGRKLVTLPNGDTAPVRQWDVAPTSLQLALARGHRWLAMPESGEAKSLKEIATGRGSTTVT